MTRLPSFLCAALVFGLGLLLLPSAGLAGSTYSITADPATDIPTETITHEGEEYTIDSVSRISPDDTVQVKTSVPDGTGYRINLRGPDNQIISSELKAGDGSHVIDYFGSGEAGSYAITIQERGMAKAVTPVILQGYDISVSAPERVKWGESVTVTATLEERSIEKHSSLDYVQLVVGNDERELQPVMEQIDETTYEATFSTAELDSESYNLYVGARGDETVRDQAEILALSDPHTITVTDETTPTRTDQKAEPGNSDTPTQTPAKGTTTPSQTPTESSPTPTPTVTPSDVSTSESSPTKTPTDGVINPNSPTTEPTTDDEGAGFSVPVVLVALLCSLYLLREV